jgi:lipid-binding SYLF domain-containing protein
MIGSAEIKRSGIVVIGLLVTLACSTPGNNGAAEGVEPGGSEAAEAQADAQELASEAASTLRDMQADQELAAALESARGVFVVPTYGQGAIVVGGRGGEAVALVRDGGAWNGPGFYDLGGVSVGAQIGGEGGQIAMLLMTERAVENLKQENDFSFNAAAGLTVIDWSRKAEATAGTGDVILWSDTEGAFAGANLGVTGINWDDEQNDAYYGEGVTPEEVLSGAVSSSSPNPIADVLGGDPAN